MTKRISFTTLTLIALGVAWIPSAHAAESDPSACLSEIERVCVHLEDHLETCLAQRGNQLSASCQSVLKTAMSAMSDPSGPASCVNDIQRECPNIKTNALAPCVMEKQAQFSKACQTYLQSAGQKEK